MKQLQKVGALLNGRIQFQALPSSSLYQPKRLQTTAQAVDNDQHQSEWDRARPLKEIPTFSKLSTFCNFLPGGKFHNLSYAQLFEQIYKEYGGIFVLPGLLGKKMIVITYNPQDFEKVYRAEGIWPNRWSFETMAHHRGELRKDLFKGIEGLLHTQGEQWGTFRSAINPVLMQPRVIKPYVSKISAVNLQFIQRIREIRDPTTLEVPENFEEELTRYNLESVSVVALDKEIGLIQGNRDDPEAKQLFKNLITFFRLLYELEIEPSFWKIVRTPKYHQMMSALDGINEFVIKYIEEAVQRLEKSPNDKPESEKGVLEKLLKIDKRIATVMAMDMLIVGVDTTTTAITGILLSLAKNPEKQQKLRTELRQVLPQKDSPFTEESLNKMPYLRACIKESLRVYPLVPCIIRNIDKDVVLSGFRIPKGTGVSMVNLMAKDDPKYYIEPKEFLPERWLRCNTTDAADGIQGSSSTNPFTYLPFGFGPRMCVGRRIAELELEVTVARIIRNFNVEFNYSVENAFKSYLIFVPAIPLKFKFTDITN